MTDVHSVKAATKLKRKKNRGHIKKRLKPGGARRKKIMLKGKKDPKNYKFQQLPLFYQE